MVLPPASEFFASCLHALQQLHESAIIGPEVISRPKQRDDPLRFARPAFSKYMPRTPVGQNVQQQVLVLWRQLAKFKEPSRRIIPGQDVQRRPVTYAGCSRLATNFPIVEGTPSRENAGLAFASARRRRWACSTAFSLSALARASIVVRDGATARPCSSLIYHSVLIPAASATSSRRSPGVRRRPLVVPAVPGSSLSRRTRRKSPSATLVAVNALLERSIVSCWYPAGSGCGCRDPTLCSDTVNGGSIEGSDTQSIRDPAAGGRSR